MTIPSDLSSGGLVKEDLVVGRGASASSGDDVVVHYVGWLTNGQQFDSSRARRDPLDFALGAGDVIKGWDQGIEGMRTGGKRKLTIPAELAYGDKGCGGVIPPHATLVFEVELLEIASRALATAFPVPSGMQFRNLFSSIAAKVALGSRQSKLGPEQWTPELLKRLPW